MASTQPRSTAAPEGGLVAQNSPKQIPSAAVQGNIVQSRAAQPSPPAGQWRASHSSTAQTDKTCPRPAVKQTAKQRASQDWVAVKSLLQQLMQSSR